VNKPDFVERIEKRTGLKCRFKSSWGEGKYSTWYLLSPTDFELFELSGYSDSRLGSVTAPDIQKLDPREP